MKTWFAHLFHTCRRELRLALATRRGTLLVAATLLCTVVPSLARVWLQARGAEHTVARPQLSSVAKLYGPEVAQDLASFSPVLLSLSLILLLATPLLVLIVGHDWVSRDVADRTFRGVALRTSWTGVLVGKGLALWLSVSLLLLLAHALVGIGVWFGTGSGVGPIAASVSKLWSACALSALPYAALVIAVSAITGSAARSLILGAAAIVALIMLKVGVPLDPELAKWLLPAQNDALLLRSELQMVTGGVGRLLVWSAACLGLASLVFRRREI